MKKYLLLLLISILFGCSKPVQIDREKPVSEIYPYPRIYVTYWGKHGKGHFLAKSIRIDDTTHQLHYEELHTGITGVALDAYEIRYYPYKR